MFPYVTFCTPGISRARGQSTPSKERSMATRSYIKKDWPLECKRQSIPCESKGKDPDYKEERLPLEQIISEEIESITRWNHGLHPDQNASRAKRAGRYCSRTAPRPATPACTHHPEADSHRTPCSIPTTTLCGCSTKTPPSRICFAYPAEAQQLRSRSLRIEGPGGEIPEVYLYQGDNNICRAHRYAR